MEEHRIYTVIGTTSRWAIAELPVTTAQAKGEVIAIALRLGDDNTSFDIIVSSNSAIPTTTINYLTTI